MLSTVLWYVGFFLLGVACGGIITHSKDVFSIFKKGSEVSEKKALLFISVLTIIGTFSYSYINSVVPVDCTLDVGWGWVVVIAATILSFLAPDAFVKISKVIAKAFADRVDNGQA